MSFEKSFLGKTFKRKKEKIMKEPTDEMNILIFILV